MSIWQNTYFPSHSTFRKPQVTTETSFSTCSAPNGVAQDLIGGSQGVPDIEKHRMSTRTHSVFFIIGHSKLP